MLTMTDIQKLARNPSASARASIAGKVASTYTAGVFNEREKMLAMEILRTLARDTEVRVRREISVHLRDALSVPRDLIRQLAEDVAEVATPLLQYSFALTEEELVEIVRATREVAKLVAVASRESISGELTEALLETRVHEVFEAVLANRGAVVLDRHIFKHWDILETEGALLDVLVARGGLSLVVAEKLYSTVTSELKNKLAEMYHLPAVVVDDAAEETHEWGMLGLAESASEGEPATDAELENFVHHLHVSDRLNYSLVIRALCTGNLQFFEAALARLAGVPRCNARMLIFDDGPLGFKAIYEKAQMPEGFYPAIHALLKISLEETSYGRFKREDFRSRVIKGVRGAGYDETIENMPYLLAIIGGKIASTTDTIH
jgi:uncharacterized protein (DUF2336 family)